MIRRDAIKEILSYLDDNGLCVFTTGMISREAFSAKDSAAHFYMIGSMGLASSFGLGIALNTTKKVVIFDGDGSALMDMGTMALAGSLGLKNFIHIVLDNESYQSTGGQPTISGVVALENVARACGYKKIIKIIKKEQFKDIKKALKGKGPIFILVKVDKSGSEDIKRVDITPEQIKERFLSAI